MPFTEEEKRAWHEQKRLSDERRHPVHQPEPIAVCVNCQNPFGINGGVVTEEVALCDFCLGD